MDANQKEVLNVLLVKLFNEILHIEEHALKKGPFSTLTMNELHVIEAIGYADSHPMNHVATRLNVTVGTLSIAINNLVRKGFVDRVRDEHDRRVVKVCLNENGRAAFKHHEAFHKEMIDYTISVLQDGEGDVLVKVLSKLTEYFKEKYPL